MLSKVAERVYWTARYIERVESTARMISIYDKLLFDLPRNINISWYNLISINGLEHDFNERYTVRDERNVIKFLIGDTSNYSSIVSSLYAIRENVRTTRDVVLEETWELTNELNMYVNDNLRQGINRSQRHEFLETIIKGCQQIQGLLYGNMPHDAAWDFLALGRSLERADMTTRNLDAGMAVIMDLEDDEHAINSHQIIWGNVLRSLNADQAYRRNMRAAVKGEAVVEYLLYDKAVPRAIAYCLNSMRDTCQQLPRNNDVTELLETMQQTAVVDINRDTLGEPLREHLNQLQIQLNKLHQTIGQTWFPELI